MLPCEKKSCAYKKHIPGDCHIACTFNWGQASEEIKQGMPQNQSKSSHTNQWFRFPFNFDPVWGPESCPALSETKDSNNAIENNPWFDLISMLR